MHSLHVSGEPKEEGIAFLLRTPSHAESPEYRWHRGAQHTECLARHPPGGCRWEPAHSETHGPAPVCTSPVHPSPLEPSAACYTRGKGFLPLLLKLNHNVTYSSKSELIFQNVNSINLALASRLLFFRTSKWDLSVFTAIYLLIYPTNPKKSTNFITQTEFYLVEVKTLQTNHDQALQLHTLWGCKRVSINNALDIYRD